MSLRTSATFLPRNTFSNSDSLVLNAIKCLSLVLAAFTFSCQATVLTYTHSPNEEFTHFGDGIPRYAFSLPTINPRMFGFLNAVGINFDVDGNGHPIPSGVAITNQYENLGIVANGPVTYRDNDYVTNLEGGTPPNAVAVGMPGFPAGDMVFTFIRPVQAFGFINIGPFGQRMDVFDGPGGTGNRLATLTAGQEFTSDQFMAAYSTTGRVIKSFVLQDVGGPAYFGTPIDELVYGDFATGYAPVPVPNGLSLLAAGLIGLIHGTRRIRSK